MAVDGNGLCAGVYRVYSIFRANNDKTKRKKNDRGANVQLQPSTPHPASRPILPTAGGGGGSRAIRTRVLVVEDSPYYIVIVEVSTADGIHQQDLAHPPGSAVGHPSFVFLFFFFFVKVYSVCVCVYTTQWLRLLFIHSAGTDVHIVSSGSLDRRSWGGLADLPSAQVCT